MRFFGIDAHIAHAAPFEAGLMITSFCGYFPDDYADFWDRFGRRPIGVSLTLLCLSQIFVYNHVEPRTGFLAQGASPCWFSHQCAEETVGLPRAHRGVPGSLFPLPAFTLFGTCEAIVDVGLFPSEGPPIDRCGSIVSPGVPVS